MKPKLKLACNHAEEPLFVATRKTLHFPDLQLASPEASDLINGIVYLTEISDECKGGQ